MPTVNKQNNYKKIPPSDSWRDFFVIYIPFFNLSKNTFELPFQ